MSLCDQVRQCCAVAVTAVVLIGRVADWGTRRDHLGYRTRLGRLVPLRPTRRPAVAFGVPALLLSSAPHRTHQESS